MCAADILAIAFAQQPLTYDSVSARVHVTHTNISSFCSLLSAWSSNVLELCFYRTVLHQRQFFFRCLHLHFLQCITHIQTLHDTILTKYVTVHFTIQLINNEKSIFNVRIRVNYVESSTNIVHTYVFSLLLYSWCPLSCPCAFFLNIFFFVLL